MNRNVRAVTYDTNRRRPTMSITPRQFATTLGALLLLGGLFFLMYPVSADYDAGMFGDQSVDCGATFSPDDRYSGEPAAVCDDAIGTRRAWAWPVTVVGLVVLAGGLLIRPARATASE